MKQEQKKRPKKCLNCIHAGRQFKIGLKNHMQCMHPKWNEENVLTGWETLREFGETCSDHEFKSKKPCSETENSKQG